MVSSGRLDPSQASALVDDVLKALRGLSWRNRWKNRASRDHLQDLGVASQRNG